MNRSIPNWMTSALLRVHARAARTPYFDLPGYMLRNWVLGARSVERNRDNPAWDQAEPPCAGVLYRWICHHVAIRAHTILRSDRDRHLHDHPSWSVSIVLDGGYWEVFKPTQFALTCPLMYRAALDTIKQSWIAPESAGDHEYLNAFGIYWRGPGAVVVRRAGDFHRLILPRATVAKSIFVMGRRTNSWGFLTQHGKVGWRVYLASPDAVKPHRDETSTTSQ
ncbi:hypothetical protein [Burkholderia sp. JKS000303]|uniref:hypothetical protein n=1 Tax=Burkholderia sp. JKS000303 TaxID=1938747 RepID=UPI000BFAA193|nr:hypothetical protein [Burkholderia sp. JKS000303]PFH29088.1 hypothetical protein BX604_2860 [Burkholderia sp. JKS000303]